MKKECQVCIHHCKLEEGMLGRCRARKNVNGFIESLNYGKITSISLDPIEKKPLFHFYPGGKILSVGSYRCNLNCLFCQNHRISMASEDEAEWIYILPQELADRALELKQNGNIGVAFTYNEPLIGYEYVRDTAKLVREYGMKNVVITNGAFSEQTASEILPYIDALNIDLKGFTNDFYKRQGGDLKIVKKFIQLAAEQCHVEVTTLVIPRENDTVEEIQAIAKWLASVDVNIPLHISRFFPMWKMQDREATPIERIYELAEEAQKYLTHVHVGNC